MRTAAALIIGNELLSGKVAEANLVLLARELRQLGILLRRSVMILDDVDGIARETAALAGTHDVVFTSGGVGPTHDDVTIEGVARAFGVGVVGSPELERLIRGHYGARVTDEHLLMARVPEGSRLVATAAVPWPTVVMKNVWVLPGVPEVFKMKLPQIRAELEGAAPFISLAVYTRADEPRLKSLLDRVVAAHRDVEIGSYPKWNDPAYRTKLTFDGLDGAAVRSAHDAFVAGLADVDGGAPVRVGHDGEPAA